MFVDSLIKDISKYCSLLSVESLIRFEDVVEFLVNIGVQLRQVIEKH